MANARFSTNGTTWSTVTINLIPDVVAMTGNIQSFVSSGVINNFAYIDGIWGAATNNGVLLKSSTGLDNFGTFNTIYNRSGSGATIGWTTQTSNFGNTSIRSLAFGNNLWAAGGYGGQLRTSTNGITWITREPNFGVTLIKAIGYANGIWLAVGGGFNQPSGQIRRSTDTITWTTSTVSLGNTVNDWYDLAYGNGRWVIVGGYSGIGNNRAASSTNGITWVTATPLNLSNLARAVGYGNGMWVISAYGARIYRSTNAVSWTEATVNLGASIYSVAYANGIWVIAGNTGRFASSTDIITWTTRNPNFGNTAIRSVSYGNGLWTAVGDAGQIRTSTNIVDWTTRTSNFGSTVIHRVAYGNGLWTIVGGAFGAGGLIRTSSQSEPRFSSISKLIRLDNTRFGVISSGILYETNDLETTFTQQSFSWITTVSIPTVNDVTFRRTLTYGNGIWVGVATSNNTHSTNSVSWTTTSKPPSGPFRGGLNPNSNIAYGNGIYIYSTSERDLSQPANSVIHNSTDGISWVSRGFSLPFYRPANFFSYTNNLWFASETFFQSAGPGNFPPAINWTLLARSTDTISWTTITNHGFITTGNPMVGMEFGTGVYVFGMNAEIKTTTDLVNWTTRTSNFGNTIIRTLTYGNGLWVAAGSSGQIRTSTNAITWVTRTSSFGNSAIQDIIYSNNIWVATGYGQVSTSTDTITWVTQTVVPDFSSSNTFNVYGNGIWVWISNGFPVVIRATANLSNISINNIIVNTGGKYIRCFNSGVLHIGDNESSLFPYNTGINDNFLNAAHKSGIYNVVGQNAIYRSIDGITWTTISTPAASGISDIISI